VEKRILNRCCDVSFHYARGQNVSLHLICLVCTKLCGTILSYMNR